MGKLAGQTKLSSNKYWAVGGLQVLYNIRPQAVTAADLEGTAYDSSLQSSKVARRPKTFHLSGFVCRHRWLVALSLLAGAAFLLLRRYRAPLVYLVTDRAGKLVQKPRF